MSELHLSIAHIPLPTRMLKLPVDQRGYPVPWFVIWIDGKPDHRVVDMEKVRRAILEKRCFTCGEKLGKYLTFNVGPVSLLSTISAEPPSHLECIEYAMQACPFLSRPYAHRRVTGLPEGTVDVEGMLEHHPIVMTAYTTQGYQTRNANPGILFKLLPPTSVVWWCEGRKATREECEAGIKLALTKIRSSINDAFLATALTRIRQWLPEV